MVNIMTKDDKNNTMEYFNYLQLKLENIKSQMKDSLIDISAMTGVKGFEDVVESIKNNLRSLKSEKSRIEAEKTAVANSIIERTLNDLLENFSEDEK